jgi:hypothetical protein
MITDIDVPQRIEELEMLLAGLFDAAKRPSVSSIDEDERRFFQLSWVTVSNADSTLDSRCALTVCFTRDQIDAYSRMPTNARDAFRARLGHDLLARFNTTHAEHSGNEKCSVDYQVRDALLLKRA